MAGAAAVLDLPPESGEFGADMEGPDQGGVQHAGPGLADDAPAASWGARVAHAVRQSRGRLRSWPALAVQSAP